MKYVLKFQKGKRKKYFRNEDFLIICTQNPNSGAFASKREDLSDFLQRFQIVNLNKFKEDELKEIAIKIAEKKNFTEENITKNIGTNFKIENSNFQNYEKENNDNSLKNKIKFYNYY